MKRMYILGLILAGLVLSLRPAGAEVLTLVPAKAAVLPSQGDGWTRVALAFDLSGLPEATGLTVPWAYVEWQIGSVGGDPKEFTAFPITASWTVEGAAQSAESVTYSETEAAGWILSENEQAEMGCLVRLYLKDLVSDWATGVSTNYGLIVATRDVAGNDLSNQLGNARLMVAYAIHSE